MFYKDGVQVTSARVGDQITYDVAGHAQIWLYQLKDGQQQFNGPYTLPMPPYTLLQQDVGQFQTYAYELTGGTFGGLIEHTSLNVSAAGSVITGGTDTSSLLLYGGIALVAFFLLRR